MPCVREQGRPFRDEVTAVLSVFLRAAGVPKRRDVVPAQTLLEDRIEVRQRRPVLVSGQAVRADHGVEFCLRPLLHVWVQGHGKKECFDDGKRLRERQRSCERAAAHARVFVTHLVSSGWRILVYSLHGSVGCVHMISGTSMFILLSFWDNRSLVMRPL